MTEPMRSRSAMAKNDDLAAFLADFPLEDAGQTFTIDLTVDDVSETMVDGEAALIIDVATSLELPVEAGQSATIIYAENFNASLGTDVLVFAGEGRARFVEFPDRNTAVIYTAVADRFSEARFQAFLDSLRFADE